MKERDASAIDGAGNKGVDVGLGASMRVTKNHISSFLRVEGFSAGRGPGGNSGSCRYLMMFLDNAWMQICVSLA